MEPRGPRTAIAISLCCALLTAITLLTGGCENTASPVAALQTFFEQIAAGKIHQAYTETAFGFQAGENEKAFESVVRDLGLLDFQSLQSEPPKIEGHSATIRLEISTRTGKRLPFVVAMENETGAWRVFTIRSPRDAQTGFAENPFTVLGKTSEIAGTVAAEPPEEKEVRRMIRECLLAFDQAVSDRSFKAFYGTVSATWRNRPADPLTEGQLERKFQPFIDHQYRVAGVAKTEAVLDRPPALDREGMLAVSGYYPTHPFKTFFSLTFIYEMPKWKLFGISVNLQQ